MKFSTHILIRVMAVVLMATGCLHAKANPDQTSIDMKVHEIFAGLVKDGAPGIAVMVRKNNRTVFQRGYGIRDLNTRTAIDAQTNFRLASCTKQFTAMAVMLLVHDGRLRYDERLTDIFPDFPPFGRRITLRNLLNHTSGLADYEELMDQASTDKTPRWTDTRQIKDSEVLTLIKTQKSGKFVPGSRWSYSNSGYVMLGLIVAQVSGEPFAEFLRERVFVPLRMHLTVAYLDGKNQMPNRAFGHTSQGSTLGQTDQSSTSATLGDGGVYSNLEDLAKWDDALTHHTLLSEAEMRPALKPARLINGTHPYWSSGPGDIDPLAGKPVSYGFGWFLDPYRGRPRMWHYGDTVGFKTAIERFTNDKLTVVVLCNRSDLDAAALVLKVADLYLTKKK